MCNVIRCHLSVPWEEKRPLILEKDRIPALEFSIRYYPDTYTLILEDFHHDSSKFAYLKQWNNGYLNKDFLSADSLYDTDNGEDLILHADPDTGVTLRGPGTPCV